MSTSPTAPYGYLANQAPAPLIQMFVDHSFPPNFKAIDERFSITKNDYRPIFAYGPKIYNPYYAPIGTELFAHEAIHSQRQGNDPEGWWRRYIAEDQFRLAEEVFAHIAEGEVLLAKAKDRNHRRRINKYIIRRLCFPMYGYNPPLSESRAKEIMRWAIREKEKHNGNATARD